MGLLLAAGALTKQSTAPLIVWILLFAVLRHRRQAFWMLIVAAAAFGTALLALQWATNGNYWFYTVTLLKTHRVHLRRVIEAHDTLMAFAPYGPALPVIAILLAARRRLAARSLLWLGLAVVSWGFGIVSFGKDGGYVNNLIPALWLIGPAALLLLRDALQAGECADLRWITGWTCLTALSGWLVLNNYSEEKFKVDPSLRERAEALNERIASLNGTVFAPYFPHLAARNGKGIHQVHIEAHNDFIWARKPFREPFATYFSGIAPDYVLLDGTEGTADIIKRDYVTLERLNRGKFDTRTRIGWSVAPRMILRRKEGR